MSGRKYSQVQLKNSIRQAIDCRLQAENACIKAESLVNSLAEAVQTTSSLDDAAESAQAALAEIQQQLVSMKTDFNELNMNHMDLSQVQKHQKAVDRLKERLEVIAQICRQGNIAAAQRAELTALIDQIERSREDRQPWLGDEYGVFANEIRNLLTSIDKEIKQTGTMQNSADKIPIQSDRYNSMIEKVSKRRKEDAERKYIASALQKVCKEMGFSATLPPQKSPLEDLIVEVDTYAYGLIHFRLQLDGTIRSQSEMIDTSCNLNFGQIEDQLKSLGVISCFRYEGDQQPVRLQKGEKSLTGSEPESGAYMREGV